MGYGGCSLKAEGRFAGVGEVRCWGWAKGSSWGLHQITCNAIRKTPALLIPHNTTQHIIFTTTQHTIPHHTVDAGFS